MEVGANDIGLQVLELELLRHHIGDVSYVFGFTYEVKSHPHSLLNLNEGVLSGKG